MLPTVRRRSYQRVKTLQRLPGGGAVKTDLQEKPELENNKIDVSQENEPDARSDNSGQDSSPPAAAGDTADKRCAAGEGDVPERHPSVVRGKQTEAPDNIGADTECQTTTSTQRGGASLTTTTPSPKHKDAEILSTKRSCRQSTSCGQSSVLRETMRKSFSLMPTPFDPDSPLPPRMFSNTQLSRTSSLPCPIAHLTSYPTHRD
ncbi:uncharacterized protein LOC144869900 [Branchiostoma floridae x Branchiostoma japonicum]